MLRGKGKAQIFVMTRMHEPCGPRTLWPFRIREADGYPGEVRWNDEYHQPARLVCELTHGPAPEGKPQARHLCGKKLCISKHCIIWGDQIEQEADKLIHGTKRGKDMNGNRTTIGGR